MSGQPLVSCICPTYNRRRFLPYLIHTFDTQEWPKNKKELIILDDSPISNKDIIDKYKKDLNIKYVYSSKRIHLGEKRNRLNNMAKGEYIFCFDDDDYYPPQRIKVGVTKMRSSKKTLSGSSILYTYYTSLNKIVVFGPYGPNHCTNGTMAYHRSFIKDHYYEKDATKAEEKFFLKDYSAEMVQVNPLDVMICISHGENTVDKRRIMNTGKDTEIKLKTLIKDKKLLQFYNSLVEEAKTLPDLEKPKMKFSDNLDLENVENGFVLVEKSFIEEKLNEAINNKAPIPVINRFEKILKKMEKGEIRILTDPDKKLLLDDVLSGKIELSKDYIELWAERMKMQNAPENIINTIYTIKELQESGKLKCSDVTQINEYNQILLADTNQIKPQIEQNKESPIIKEIFDGKIKVSKEYVKNWIDKAKELNDIELLKNMETIQVLQDNELLECEDETPINKYGNLSVKITNNKQEDLILSDVIDGKIKLSKDYVNHILELGKTQNINPKILQELEIVKNLQENNILETIENMPFNKYNNILLSREDLNIPTNNIPKQQNKENPIIKEIFDGKIKVSKEYVKNWIDKAKELNDIELLKNMETIQILQDNELLECEEETLFNKYGNLSVKNNQINLNIPTNNNNKYLILKNITDGKTIVSKDYINYWLQKASENNGDFTVINELQTIKILQENGILQCEDNTPINKYENIILSDNDKEVIERKQISKTINKEDLILSDVFNQKIVLSKDYVNYWINNIKENNGPEAIIKSLEEIRTLQDNNLLIHDARIPFNKYRNIILN